MVEVSVIIPAYNEEQIIGSTLCAVQSLGLVDEIIVVDDGSQDSTAEIAHANGVIVVKDEKNRGKGEALKTGIRHCNGKIVVFLDADVGQTATEITKMVHPIKSGQCDVAIAKFPPAAKKGGFGVVKGISRYGVERLTGKYIQSVLSGQRAFKREVLECITIGSGYGAEVGMTIDILKKGYSIQEYEVNMTHHETGRDLRGFIHRGKQAVDIIRVLHLKMRG